MQVAVEKLGGSRVALQIEADETRVTKAYDQAYREIRRNVPLPGFRKGKAPKQWIRRVVGAELIDETARDLLVEETLKDALVQEDIAALGQPEFDYEELKEGEAFSYTVTLVIKPNIELPDYKSAQVEVVKGEATDEMVDEEIENRRQQLAAFSLVSDRGIETGDFVDLDYVVYEAEQSPPAGAKRTSMALCVGEAWFQPAFDDDLIGLQVGDSKAVSRRLPHTHGNERLRGQVVYFDVMIRRVRVRAVPEIDDEFAMRAFGVEDVDEMRAEVRSAIEAELGRLHQESAQDRLIARLVDRIEADIPEPLIEMETRRRLSLWEADLARDDIKASELLAATGRTREMLAREVRPAARYAVKRRLVLDAVADAEEITATDDEINATFADMTADNGIAPEVMRRQFEEAGILGEITDQIRQGKALMALLDAAEHVEVDELSELEKQWLEGGPMAVEQEDAPDDSEEAESIEADDSASVETEDASDDSVEAEGNETDDSASVEVEEATEEPETEETPGGDAATEEPGEPEQG